MGSGIGDYECVVYHTGVYKCVFSFNRSHYPQRNSTCVSMTQIDGCLFFCARNYIFFQPNHSGSRDCGCRFAWALARGCPASFFENDAAFSIFLFDHSSREYFVFFIARVRFLVSGGMSVFVISGGMSVFFSDSRFRFFFVFGCGWVPVWGFHRSFCGIFFARYEMLHRFFPVRDGSCGCIDNGVEENILPKARVYSRVICSAVSWIGCNTFIGTDGFLAFFYIGRLFLGGYFGVPIRETIIASWSKKSVFFSEVAPFAKDYSQYQCFCSFCFRCFGRTLGETIGTTFFVDFSEIVAGSCFSQRGVPVIGLYNNFLCASTSGFEPVALHSLFQDHMEGIKAFWSKTPPVPKREGPLDVTESEEPVVAMQVDGNIDGEPITPEDILGEDFDVGIAPSTPAPKNDGRVSFAEPITPVGAHFPPKYDIADRDVHRQRGSGGRKDGEEIVQNVVRTGDATKDMNVYSEIFKDDLLLLTRRLGITHTAVNTYDSEYGDVSDASHLTVVPGPMSKLIEDGRVRLSEFVTEDSFTHEGRMVLMLPPLPAKTVEKILNDVQINKVDVARLGLVILEYLHPYPCSTDRWLSFADSPLRLRKFRHLQARAVPVEDFVRSRLYLDDSGMDRPRVIKLTRRCIAYYLFHETFKFFSLPDRVRLNNVDGLSSDLEMDCKQVWVDVSFSRMVHGDYEDLVKKTMTFLPGILHVGDGHMSFGGGGAYPRRVIKFTVRKLGPSHYKLVYDLWLGTGFVSCTSIWKDDSILRLDYTDTGFLGEFISSQGDDITSVALVRKPKFGVAILLSKLDKAALSQQAALFSESHGDSKRRVHGVATQERGTGNVDGMKTTFVRQSTRASNYFRMEGIPDYWDDIFCQNIMVKVCAKFSVAKPDGFIREFHESGASKGTILIKTIDSAVLHAFTVKAKTYRVVEQFTGQTVSCYFVNVSNRGVPSDSRKFMPIAVPVPVLPQQHNEVDILAPVDVPKVGFFQSYVEITNVSSSTPIQISIGDKMVMMCALGDEILPKKDANVFHTFVENKGKKENSRKVLVTATEVGVLYDYPKGQGNGRNRHSGIVLKGDDEIGERISKLQSRVESILAAEFNACIWNFYADGKSQLGGHIDAKKSESDHIKNSWVATVVVGASRPMLFEAEGHYLVLNHGDLIAWQVETALRHGVPPFPGVRGKRTSLSFRHLAKESVGGKRGKETLPDAFTPVPNRRKRRTQK